MYLYDDDNDDDIYRNSIMVKSTSRFGWQIE